MLNAAASLMLLHALCCTMLYPAACLMLLHVLLLHAFSCYMFYLAACFNAAPFLFLLSDFEHDGGHLQ
jgi:hypothetical protein